jgi:hypothetical protein
VVAGWLLPRDGILQYRVRVVWPRRLRLEAIRGGRIGTDRAPTRCRGCIGIGALSAVPRHGTWRRWRAGSSSSVALRLPAWEVSIVRRYNPGEGESPQRLPGDGPHLEGVQHSAGGGCRVWTHCPGRRLEPGSPGGCSLLTEYCNTAPGLSAEAGRPACARDTERLGSWKSLVKKNRPVSLPSRLTPSHCLPLLIARKDRTVRRNSCVVRRTAFDAAGTTGLPAFAGAGRDSSSAGTCPRRGKPPKRAER